MRKVMLLILIVISLAGFQVQAQSASKKQKKSETNEVPFELKTILDTISYIVGTDVAFTLKNNDMDLNATAFSKGFADAWIGNDSIFTTAQAEAIMVKYGSELQEKRQKEKAEQDAIAIAAGKEFLEQNKLKEGVITTESGLQYTIIKQGEGERPEVNSAVHVHYKGMLLDGTVFDSSYKRETHNTFELNKLIPGWTEGIQLMPTGSIYKFFISPELGYGDREVGIIPPNSTLIFEVELLGFE